MNSERLKSVVRYDPDAGLFVWLVSNNISYKIGDVCGTYRKDGYIHIKTDGRSYLAHRLAWLYVYGNWPTGQIDHIDGMRHNNRLANLRDVSQSVNLHNQKKARVDSKSGHLGVYWNNSDRKWMAQITSNGSQRCLGYFSDITDAIAARLAAEAIYHPSKPAAKTLQLRKAK
jgi:hypothetical protein